MADSGRSAGRLFSRGPFIEYLCGLTLSMSAEQVHDASFEGVPAYGFEFRKETDRIEKPWYPDQAVHRGEYTRDADQPFNGRLAQLITAGQIPLTIQLDADLPADPALDNSATWSADGAVLAVFAVNHTASIQSRTLDVAAFAPLAECVEIQTLLDTWKAGERDAANSWREPDRIRTVADKTTLAGDTLTYAFPPLSVTFLEFRGERPPDRSP